MGAIRELVIPAVFLAAGLLLMFHPMLLSRFHESQANPGDPRLLNWMLEHSFLWLQGVPANRSFWDPPFFFPARNTAAYTEILLSVAPVYWVFRLVGLVPDSAFQAWMLAISAINFLVAHLFLRRCLRFHALASAGGAALFAFGSPRVNQLGHQQLLPQFFSLTAVWCLYRLVEGIRSTPDRPRLSRMLILAVGFFGSIVAQLYAAFYLGWFFILALGLATIVAASDARWRPFLLDLMRRCSFPLTAGALAAAAALTPMALHYLAAAREVGPRPWSEIMTMLPWGRSWLLMGAGNWVWGWMARTKWMTALPMGHEHAIGLGVATSILVILGLRARMQEPLVRIMVFAIGILFFAALMPPFGRMIPWRLVYEIVPAAKAIRGVSRIGLMALMPASIGLAAFIERVVGANLPRPLSGLLAFVVGAFALAEQGSRIPSYDKLASRRNVDAIAAQLHGRGCKIFLYTPPHTDYQMVDDQLDAMAAALASRVPTINGISGNRPPGWGLLYSNVTSDAREREVEQALEAWVRARGLDAAGLCRVPRDPRANRSEARR